MIVKVINLVIYVSRIVGKCMIRLSSNGNHEK